MLLSSLRFLLLFLFMFSYLHAESDETAFDLYNKSEYQKAIPLLLKLANDGNLRAQAALGDAYLYGKGVDKSSDNAFMWLNKCLGKGSIRCENNTADAYYYSDIGPEVNYEKAAEFYKKAFAIDENDDYSLYMLGLMYEYGNGVEKNINKSFDIYSKLSNRNYIYAQTRLGYAYFYGKGVSKDNDKALEIFRIAAKDNNPDALAMVGYFYEKGLGIDQDYYRAAEFYKKAIEYGSHDAKYNLAYLYDNGFGLDKNIIKAMELFYEYYRLTGDDKAYEVGDKLFSDRQFDRSIKYFEVSADKGNLKTKERLGILYYKGRYVEKDLEKAGKYFQDSSSLNNPSVEYLLAMMYYDGDPYPQNFKKAEEWFIKSSDHGDKDALFSLGYLHETGKLGEVDYIKASGWYEKGVKAGDKNSINQLASLYENGLGVKKDLNKALDLYKNNNIKKYKILKNRLECLKTASTQLFDTYLKCADRNNMMAAMKEAGVKVKVEDKNKWSDIYFTSNILKGTSELTVSYTVDDYFSKAKYIFPAKQMDLLLVSNVKDMIASKYGEPSQSIGKPNLGKVTYKWKLQDGINIEVFRGWPNTTTYLAFIYPENNKAMLAEMERQRKAREAKKYNSQDNAF